MSSFREQKQTVSRFMQWGKKKHNCEHTIAFSLVTDSRLK